MWALQKTEEDLSDVLEVNCVLIVLSSRLTSRISKIKLYEKCGSISFSRAIMS